jgi:hypothetical protein
MSAERANSKHRCLVSPPTKEGTFRPPPWGRPGAPGRPRRAAALAAFLPEERKRALLGEIDDVARLSPR